MQSQYHKQRVTATKQFLFCELISHELKMNCLCPFHIAEIIIGVTKSNSIVYMYVTIVLCSRNRNKLVWYAYPNELITVIGLKLFQSASISGNLSRFKRNMVLSVESNHNLDNNTTHVWPSTLFLVRISGLE